MKIPAKIPNAHKWTLERVTDHLYEIQQDAFEGDVMFLGRALIRQGQYADDWRYWKKLFANNDNIMELMKRIESIFEARLYEAALKKEVSPWVAMFGLKNNHHWCDKPESEMEETKAPPMLIELADDMIIVIDGDQASGTYKKIDCPTYPTDETRVLPI